MTRLLESSCIVLTALLALASAAQADVTLRGLAEQQGLHVGAMILDATWQAPAQKALVASQFNAATVGAYWTRTRPSATTFDWSVTDSAVSWAAGAGLDIHLHPLLYPTDSQNPAWVLNSSPSAALSILQTHITTTMDRYKAGSAQNPSSGVVWDVVNEAVGPDGNYRSGWWLGAMPAAAGDLVPAYIIKSFEVARAADPHAILLYNDHDIELSNGYQTNKWNRVKEIVLALLQRGLIDGLGWELHTNPDEVLGNQLALQERMSWAKSLGLKNFVSELDMAIGSGNDELQRQGDAYNRVTRIWLAENNGGWLQTWGVYDGQSWLGSGARPLLFDANYLPKSACAGVSDALLAAVPELGGFHLCSGVALILAAATMRVRRN